MYKYFFIALSFISFNLLSADTVNFLGKNGYEIFQELTGSGNDLKYNLDSLRGGVFANNDPSFAKKVL